MTKRNIERTCEKCGNKADVYAMGPKAGDWGGNYCNEHIPKGFGITDRYKD